MSFFGGEFFVFSFKCKEFVAVFKSGLRERVFSFYGRYGDSSFVELSSGVCPAAASAYGAAEFAFIVQRLEIAPPEALVKICVLVRCLPPVRLETVILLLYNRDFFSKTNPPHNKISFFSVKIGNGGNASYPPCSLILRTKSLRRNMAQPVRFKRFRQKLHFSTEKTQNLHNGQFFRVLLHNTVKHDIIF